MLLTGHGLHADFAGNDSLQTDPFDEDEDYSLGKSLATSMFSSDVKGPNAGATQPKAT